MNSLRLIRDSLLYYWRTNLAVVLGVVAATAVIAGALIVGDSVRDSLRQMSLERLGAVDHALSGQRFVREELAETLNGVEGPDAVEVAPAIAMTASLTRDVPGRDGQSQGAARAGAVQVYALDERLWKQLAPVALPLPEENSVVLNRRTATQLSAEVGDEISAIIEIPAAIPRDALLGDRDATVTELLLEVSGIAEDASVPGRFGLNPSQQLPLNAFVSLDTLQQQLGLAELRPTRRNPIAKPARVNALFASAGGNPAAISGERASELTRRLDEVATLADLSIKLTRHDERHYLSLESDQMILELSLADAGEEVARELGWQTSPVLVYLLNRIGTPTQAEGEPKAGYSMYSVVAGVEFNQPAPFGPFEYVAGGPPQTTSAVSGDPIPAVLNEWLADDLEGVGGDGALIEVGATFPVEYHVVGDRGELPVERRTFVVSGIAKLDSVAGDPGFTPVVEGVTDVETYSDWREPFPLDHDAITDRDDDYWEERRATPKLFLPPKAAQSLWSSRYGNLTSLRVAPPEGMSLDAAAAEFEKRLLEKLGPEQTGLAFQPVKLQGLQAASGTTDFTGLFLGFSFFLIAAAMLLIGLLFRLGVERRVRELGLLSAIGLTPQRVRLQALGEGTLLAVVGAVIGLPAAVGYAGLMVYGLTTWWRRAIGTQFLFLSVRPLSLAIGLCCGILVALAAIGWALWQTRKLSTRELLHGQTEPQSTAARVRRRGRIAVGLSAGSLGIAAVVLIASLAGMVPAGEAFGGLSYRVVAFFLVGLLLLTGCISGLAAWLNADRAVAVRGEGFAALARLGLRNAARHRGRSILTASLIASAAFVIVAVASGRRNPELETPRKESGNGGFTLVAQSSQPVLYDINTTEGRGKLRLDQLPAEQQRLLDSMHVVPFRVRPGEDASCLNLYQTRLPTILGVPPDVIEVFDKQERFRFADTPAHPWKLLQEELPHGRIPVLGDMNTLMFSLKKGIGGEIEIPDEALVDSKLDEATLQVAGMLDGSIFQGVLLVSEANFHRLFPSYPGFRYFLIAVEPAQAEEATQLLESRLTDVGFDVDSVAARLRDFLAVQNTYLSTFQTLGGLGLLLGTIGLATVMLRNVLERRNELALLRAVGFRNSRVSLLVLIENAALLCWGLTAGATAAVLAMLPHLVSTGAETPWRDLAWLLAAVLVVGLLAPLAAVYEAVRTPIVATLRSE
jgi:ABC-type antimicrobial peptide transport system permease subunit